MSDTVVLVPLRSFAAPKTRLAGALSPAERVELVRELADGVVAALGAWHVAVVSDDPEVTRWAADAGVRSLAPAVDGLNASVTAATALAAVDGAGRVAIVHADLAQPGALDEVLRRATAPERERTVTAVPDTRVDGTNVLVVPTGAGFAFRYGVGSFERHRAEAQRCGLAFAVDDVPALGRDVDTVDDLRHYRRIVAP